MPRQDTTDFITAFAVGTVLGIGATLLLQPERTPKQRVARQLKPYRKRMRRSYGQAREALREGAGATADLSSVAAGAGRDLLSEFRTEMSKVLGEARDEFQELVEDQLNDLRGHKKRRRWFGR